MSASLVCHFPWCTSNALCPIKKRWSKYRKRRIACVLIDMVNLCFFPKQKSDNVGCDEVRYTNSQAYEQCSSQNEDVWRLVFIECTMFVHACRRHIEAKASEIVHKSSPSHGFISLEIFRVKLSSSLLRKV